MPRSPDGKYHYLVSYSGNNHGTETYGHQFITTDLPILAADPSATALVEHLAEFAGFTAAITGIALLAEA